MNNNKIHARDLFDIGMVSSLFLAIFLRVYNVSFLNQFDFVSKGNSSFYTPLVINLNLQILILASFFLFKVLRYKSCEWSKVFAIFYFIDRLILCILICSGTNVVPYNKSIPYIYFAIFLITGMHILYKKIIKETYFQ